MTNDVALLVEDERQMRRFLRAFLTSHGFQLIEAETAEHENPLVTASASSSAWTGGASRP